MYTHLSKQKNTPMQHKIYYQTMLDKSTLLIFEMIEKMEGLYGKCSTAHLMRHFKITFQAANNYLAYYDLHKNPCEEVINIVNYSTTNK